MARLAPAAETKPPHAVVNPETREGLRDHGNEIVSDRAASQQRELRIALLFALVALLAGPTHASAWKQLASDSDSGEYPFAVASGYVERPAELRVKVASVPFRSIDLTVDRECYRGKRSRGRETGHSLTFDTTLYFRPTLRRSDDCIFSASAASASFEAPPGRIDLELAVRKRPKRP